MEECQLLLLIDLFSFCFVQKASIIFVIIMILLIMKGGEEEK